MPRLQDKAIIVTGSTTGIGEAMARRFVAEGACVIVHGLEEQAGQRIVDELNAQRADSAALLIADIADPDVPQQLVDLALDRFGCLDAVVNNAAWVARSTVETTDAQLFDRVMAINVRGPLLLIRAALAELSKRRGCVLNIGSVNAYAGEPSFLAYSTSKGALMTLTRNLGDTLHREQGVRVNQINPEWVLTENEKQQQQGRGMPEDWHTKLSPMWTPSGRLIEPAEIAEAAVYWLSDACGPISGSVLDLGQFPLIGRNPPKSIE